MNPVSMLVGRYTLGPDCATLSIHTGTEGKLARAGHSLELVVDDWSAAVRLQPSDPQISLSANSRSLRVVTGAGGMQPLDEDAKKTIVTNIESEVLRGGEIEFRSTRIDANEGSDVLHVHGDLNLLGVTRAVAFTLTIGRDGTVQAEAVVRQTDHGITPFAAMYGALKVKDEVRLSLAGQLQTEDAQSQE